MTMLPMPYLLAFPGSSSSSGWVSRQQAALMHGVSVGTLPRRIRALRLPAHRFGGRLIKIRIEDLEALFRPIPVGDQRR